MAIICLLAVLCVANNVSILAAPLNFPKSPKFVIEHAMGFAVGPLFSTEYHNRFNLISFFWELDRSQVSEATTAFYQKAKRTLIKQMLAICFAIVVFLAATWVIHFTKVGTYTAIIPLVVRVRKTK